MSRLAQLKREIAACTLCRDAPQKGPALPSPRPIVQLGAKARILIASQAPGMRAHASGVPFQDPSGARLREWLGVGSQAFYDPACFAILPMGFCFPGHDSHGSDLPPRGECRTRWQEEILAALPGVRLILMIGRHAQAYHLRRSGRPDLLGSKLEDTVRNWRAVSRCSFPHLFPLPHPSWRNSGWLAANPWFATELLPVLRETVRDALG